MANANTSRVSTAIGERHPRHAVVLVVLGIWVAASPSSVPRLTEPGGTAPMMEMEMET